jgi:rhodanese-related sulfurtransferase
VPRRTVTDLLEQSRRHLRRLDPGAAYSAMRGGALLIDTRSEEDLARRGRVPGSLHIPLSVLEWRVDPGSSHRNPQVGGLDRHLILLCAQGYSSSLAARRLQELGFSRATDVIGGFEAWEAAGLPVERR